MTTQSDMFDAPVEVARRPTKDQPITRSELTHSIKASYKVEGAIWANLYALGITEQSSPADVRLALASVRRECPAWCSLEAWDRIADSFRTWATAFGNLQLFWALRRKRGE